MYTIIYIIIFIIHYLERTFITVSGLNDIHITNTHSTTQPNQTAQIFRFKCILSNFIKNLI